VAEPQVPPPARSESREIAELRRLKQEQPDLSSAVDLQIELLQLQRRVQSRVSLPSIRLDRDYLNSQLASAPVLRFEHLPIEWGDLRFLLRATASAMRTHEAIEERDFRRIETLCRDAERLPGALRSWYEATGHGAPAIHADAEGLEPVLLQAMRPFLTRSADAVMAKTDLVGWTHGTCPLCGGEPDFSVITVAADRVLICGRCSARWRFPQLTCPFCRQPRRPVPAQRVRRVRALSEGVRCATRAAARDAGRRCRRHASARCRRDAEGVQIEASIKKGPGNRRTLLDVTPEWAASG
jgi:formate dehydrogenase maturation protein FdhE